MLDFEGITNRIPGSFTGANAEAYYFEARRVCRGKDSPVFVEVGVDQGRSASVIMQAIIDSNRLHSAHMILVDSWESVLKENKEKVRNLASSFGVSCTILHMKSSMAEMEVYGKIDMLLIDADHTEGHPNEDCTLWLPKLRTGGVACFHDFESGFPAVDQAVYDHTYLTGWVHLGDFEGLAIRVKP